MRDIKAQLDEFMAHKQKKVLMLKGKWGVGKTYFWKHYLEAKNVEGMLEKKRSYVSLFGVGSTEEVEQLVLCKTMAQRTDKKWFSKTKDVGRKGLEWLPDLADVVGASGAARRFASLFVKNYLVCFDDVERRNPALTMGALLGFVSVLKEENNCRIVLILNEQELTDEDKKELSRYREKVMDEEITYEPTVEENAEIIFGQRQDLAFFVSIFRRLDLNNIRVMQQTSWNIEYLEPFTTELEPSLRALVLNHAVTLSTFYHVQALGVDVHFLHSGVPRMPALFSAPDAENKETEDPEVTAATKAGEYGYRYDGVDSYILDYIQNGSCDESGLREYLAVRNEHEKKSNVTQRLWALWEVFGANFSVSQSEMIRQVSEFLDKCVELLDESQFDQLCDLLKDLGSDGSVQKWRERFVKEHIDAYDIRDLSGFRRANRSPELRKLIEERMRVVRSEFTLQQMFTRFAERTTWDENLLPYMDAYSQEEFSEWILKEDRDGFLESLRDFRMVLALNRADRVRVSLDAKITNALRSISARSSLDRLRIANRIGPLLPVPPPVANGAAAPVAVDRQGDALKDKP